MVAISAEDWNAYRHFTVINSTASLASLPSFISQPTIYETTSVCVCVCVRVYCMYVCVCVCVCLSLCRKFYLLWRCGGLTGAFLHEVGWWSAFLPMHQPQDTAFATTASIPAKSISQLGPLIFFQAQPLIHFTLCLFVMKTLLMISETKRSECRLNWWWLSVFTSTLLPLAS